MSVCIIGKNLTALMLSKILINKGIRVDLFYQESNNIVNLKKNYTRTLGLSNYSTKFLSTQKISLNKYLWKVKEIDLFRKKNSVKFLNFSDEENCFSIISYNIFYNLLKKSLKQKKLYLEKKQKKNFFKELINNHKYEIIINTEKSNILFRKFFSNQLKKDYESVGFTTIIKHNKITNNTAQQYFTSYGPLAFLPLSNFQTSVVFSVFDKAVQTSEKKVEQIIKDINTKYKIKSLKKFEQFPISLSLSRNYFHKKFLMFGDGLHKIHPIAGQGFNMTIRDASVLSNLIKDNLDLGLSLDNVLKKFEKERKKTNFLFATGVDFFHEFFKFTDKYDISSIDKVFNFINQNKYIKSKLKNYADKGISPNLL
tara:strand:+ start:2231 stop:3334 length:1104 start_codon:yes stop_codon:yes gene_type:complete